MAGQSYGQDPELSASLSETKIFTGEQFTLSIEVQSSGTHSMQLPQLPVIEGARVVSSNPSRSTSISIVNGRTTRTTSYIYTLIAAETGNYTVPSIPVVIDNVQRNTEPLPFEVIEKGNLSDGQSQLPDIFVEVEVDEEQPVTGQQIVASIVLYFKQGIEVTSFQPAFGWRTDGFWKEELENISQPRAESTILSGVRYRKATLLRYALFPSRSGTMTLNEYGLTVGMRTQPSRNDPFGSFFGSGTNQRRVELKSDPLELSIRRLPDREPSVDMNAVGDFSIERSVNKTSVETGETLELQTTVRGEGNIPLLRRPEYDLPDQIELFTPRESSNVEREGLTIRGEKTYTQQMVIRTPDKIVIPAARVAVYDPSANSYIYEDLSEITLDVTPAPVRSVAAAGENGLLQPVTGLAVWHSSTGESVYQRAWFWIFLILPLIALIAGWFRKRYMQRLMTDTHFRRAEFAEKAAFEHLDKAKEELEKSEDEKEIYNMIHKSVSGFVSDKIGMQEAGFSDQQIIEEIQKRSVNGQTLKSLKYLLDKCSTISFAPTGGKDDIGTDIQKAEKLINELKQQL